MKRSIIIEHPTHVVQCTEALWFRQFPLDPPEHNFILFWIQCDVMRKQFPGVRIWEVFT